MFVQIYRNITLDHRKVFLAETHPSPRRNRIRNSCNSYQGSEYCRHIARFNPEILLEFSEKYKQNSIQNLISISNHSVIKMSVLLLKSTLPAFLHKFQLETYQYYLPKFNNSSHRKTFKNFIGISFLFYVVDQVKLCQGPRVDRMLIMIIFTFSEINHLLCWRLISDSSPHLLSAPFDYSQ